METRRFMWMLLLSGSLCVCDVGGAPVGTSTLNCTAGSVQQVGVVDEGYTGEVEILSKLADEVVELVGERFPEHLQFLEISSEGTSVTISTKKPLDADELKATGGVLYYAVQCRNGLLNDRTLKINDINDNAPIFEKKLYSRTVPETHAVGTEVLRVTAVDADATGPNNRVSYYILPPASADFEVQVGDGAFLLKRRLNYNTVENYNYTVEARDNGGRFDRAIVLLEVEDYDNMNPYFSHTQYQASVQEDHTGPLTNVLPEAIKAQDGDTGINVAVVYSISSVSPSKYLSNFNIDQNTGVISVVTTLDREEIDMVTVNIKAAQTDDSLKTAEAVVSVNVEDVNDNAPELDQDSYSASLMENSAVGTVVLRVRVTDLDQGGFVGTLRIIPESAPFSVDSDGTVRVKTPAELDRETVGSIVFQIEAEETAPPNQAVTAEVTVTLLDENDNSPTFSSSKYEGKVFKNQTVGMLVSQVEAEDPDAGPNGQVRYSIDWGNQEGYFAIDDITGEITLVKPIPLEENKQLQFSLAVTAWDGGTVSRFTTVLVEVLAPGDSKPQFLLSTYQGTIEEEKDPGVFIVKVSFLAIPTAVPVTLQVLTDTDKFSVDNSGVFSSTAKLDYETQRSYSVGISISDGTNEDQATVEVEVTDINDNSPVFTSASMTITVPEDIEEGADITTVTAADADAGFNGELRYSLQGGGGRFSIDPEAGLVTLGTPLDRETQTEFTMEVVVQDLGRPPRSSTAVLTVQVSDVNDNGPVFSQAEYEVVVEETTSVGTNLATLMATDPDDGPNGQVSYSISRQDPPSTPAVFELDPSTGVLKLARELINSAERGYVLWVQASDAGSPSLAGNGSVAVTVKDVNNNPPEFSQERYDVSVSENLAGGATVATLEVTDADEDGFSNGHFLFTSDTFSINQQGVVSLKNDVTLDRETKDNYLIQVVAVDQPKDSLSATAQLHITVLDYNDNSPQFSPLPDPILVPEGDYSVANPGEVCRILATDADLGPNADVTVSISTANTLFSFREDGMLLAVGPLDRETRDVYELVIAATDNGTPRRENITSVRVSVTDVNDHPPVFSSALFSRSLLVGGAQAGDQVLTLEASDQDAGDNGRITYSFSSGSSPLLSLDGGTGVVTLASDLSSITVDTALNLTAMAMDHGQPSLSATAGVLIFLKTVSLGEDVAFQSSSYNFSLPENEPIRTPVGVVKATSGSPLYEVTYVLKTHTDLFSLDALGALTSRETLDMETLDWYILEVEAVDNRIPPTSAVTVVTVQVLDVNEAPVFSSELYQAEIFSIAPYKYPVVQVQASDPDRGHRGQLQYTLVEPSQYFEVQRSSGQVYVVSAAALAGEKTAVLVKATDPAGLYATTRVEVEVQGSAGSDVVVISLNQAANVVEEKVPQMEQSLGQVLGWIVSVIGVSSTSRGGATESRAARDDDDVMTLVSLIAMDDGKVVSGKKVEKQLQREAVAVKAGLEAVFGAGLEHAVEEEPEGSASTESVVIALAALLAASILALLVATTVMVVKFRRMKRHTEGDRESFGIDRQKDRHEDRHEKVAFQGRGSVGSDQVSQRKLSSKEEEPECDRKRSLSDDSHTSAL